MQYSFDNQTPIFIQIMEVIKTDIISGKYKSGQKLPSVREFAFEFQVNPNTILKALVELENLGLIVTERTSGKYVSLNESVLENARSSKVDGIINDYFSSMEKLGIDREKAIKLINK